MRGRFIMKIIRVFIEPCMDATAPSHPRPERRKRATMRYCNSIPTMLRENMLNLKDPSLLRQQCFINGEWCDANDASTIKVTNPATGESLGSVPHMGAAETARA